MVTQILNFGLPAPIDVQIEGADVARNRDVADQVLEQFRHVPGLTDLRVQQTFDYPKFHVTVDRTKAEQGGFSQRDIATGLLISLSGSFQTAPIFFLNQENGVNYSLVTQTPQYAIQSLTDSFPQSSVCFIEQGIRTNQPGPDHCGPLAASKLPKL